MSSFSTETVTVEHHQLERRFAGLRLPDARALAALTRSLERSGQLTPCIVVPAEAPSGFVLLDGYRRGEALKQLGEDTVWVQIWQCAVEEALGRLLAGPPTRAWAPIEEALMLRELSGGGCSQHALARRTGRDVSWVNRRLKLLDLLSEEWLPALCEGRISTWAATRVLAPLARANAEHARALLAALKQESLSTRQLREWYRHYGQANRATRERMVKHPQLFIQALAYEGEHRQARRLREGPEGQWISELERITQTLKRLRGALPTLLAGAGVCPELYEAFTYARRAFIRLEKEFEAHASPQPSRATRHGPHAQGPGHAAAPDQPDAEDLAQHRAADPALAPAGPR